MRVKNIVPSKLHEEFYEERLKQCGTHALIEEDVLSFDVFKRQIMQKSENQAKRFLEASRMIKAHAHELVNYRDMVKYPSFIEEILSFYDELCKADVAVCDLCHQNELTRILSWLEELFHQKEQEHQFKEYIVNHRFDSFRVMRGAYTDASGAKYLDKMIENGAEELTCKQVEPQKVSFKKALNPRQECEAMIQDLLQREVALEDVVVILADYENELPVLRQVAKRYRIPLEIKQLQEKSQIVDFFSAGIDLWLKRDLESLIQAMDQNFFASENFVWLKEYVQLFIENVSDLFSVFDHVSKSLEEDTLLDRREKEKLLYLEKKAEEKRQEIVEMLGDLLEVKTPLDLLVFLFESCKSRKEAQDFGEGKVLLEIKEEIEACYMLIEDSDSLCDFKVYLEKKKKTILVSQRGLKVVALSDFCSARKLAYVLSLQQENFPGFKPCEGLFDESFVGGSGYPSLSLRLKLHNDRVNWIFNCAEELVLSYCCSTYEGKGKEAAYEIEEYAHQKPVFWDLIQNETNKKVETHALSSQTAKELFVSSDGKIHGSISSFERYFYCPYSYFLQSGLRLFNEELAEVNAALIGTIQHAVLEELISKYGKQYAQTKPQEISDLVKKQFCTLMKLYVKSQKQLSCIQERMTEGLITTLEYMKDMENNTSFCCEKQEFRFEMDLLAETEVPIRLRGIIDRIDRCQDALRILDYKSSEKNLSKNKVLSGIQLQLLTYLMVAIKLLNAKPSGAYYFSLKNATVDVKAGKLNGRTFEYRETEEEDWMESWIKEEGLKGWTFDDPELLDYDARHINNLTMKDGRVVIRGEKLDFERVFVVIEKLYRILQERLLEGKIECRPLEGACLFCNYKTICRYKGLEQKITPLLEDEITISDSE